MYNIGDIVKWERESFGGIVQRSGHIISFDRQSMKMAVWCPENEGGIVVFLEVVGDRIQQTHSINDDD